MLYTIDVFQKEPNTKFPDKQIKIFMAVFFFACNFGVYFYYKLAVQQKLGWIVTLRK